MVDFLDKKYTLEAEVMLVHRRQKSCLFTEDISR